MQKGGVDMLAGGRATPVYSVEAMYHSWE